MTLMLHPSKANPQRYRVQDKELKIQRYFKLSEKEQAQAYEAELEERRKYRQLTKALPINRLFKADGSVKGLTRKTIKRQGRREYECLSIQVTVPGGQKKTEISLRKKPFNDAYRQAQDRILEMLDIERTAEITLAFNAAKPLYW